MYKACYSCGNTKLVDQFHSDKQKKDGLCPTCKQCRMFQVGARRRANLPAAHAKERQIRIKNRDTIRADSRWSMIKHRYGLSRADWESMLEAQGGTCAICEIQAPRFDVDHCHKTGKVRGLLCHKCNMGLGSFKDSIENLTKAVYYINSHITTKESTDGGR